MWRRFPRKETEPDDPDAEVFANLIEARADLAKAREIRHYLYFPDKRAAAEAARRVGGEDTEVRVEPSADEASGQWLVLVSQTLEVHPDTFHEIREPLEQLATELGGEYDGWEAATSP